MLDRVALNFNDRRFDEILAAFPACTEADRAYVRRAAHRMKLTLAYLPRGTGCEKLLDVGSMRGLFAPAYIELWNYAEITLLGSDVSDTIERVIGDRVYRFPAARCNIEIETWPFPDETFDVVVCTEVLEHLIFDPAFAMNEMNRVLKRDGRALITVPNVASDHSLLQLVNDRQPGFLRHYISDALLAGKRDLNTVYHLGHFHEYTRTELVALANATGFAVERITGLPVRPLPYRSFRFDLFRHVIRWLFPRARRIRESHVLALLKKREFIPLNELPRRFPPPLYQPLQANSANNSE